MLSHLLLVFQPLALIPQASLPALLPKPQFLRALDGSFEVTRETELVDPKNTSASKILKSMFLKGAGFSLHQTKNGRSSGTIQFHQKADGSIKTEGYELHVSKSRVMIEYADAAGALYGVETLRQLLPSAIEGPSPSPDTHWNIPCVDIKDYPRFPWRGMHLDVSRHFFPASFIKKYIDYIAMMKMNVFHWHLVDDGGWRIEISKYPRLTTVGAWRYGITTDWDQSRLRFDPESNLPKYGGFYTKQEVRDIVRYAADRSITIVPEIEMPGHTMPVLAAYPELGCTHQAPASLQGQPASNVYCAGSEKTFQFIDGVLDEVMALFPSKWIHIGGDEVDKTYWKACPTCQARIKAEGLKNEEELQSYFVRRIDKYLTSKGRRLIGWDEILEGGLAKGATVMSWRGIDGGIAAAKAGHDVVMSPYSHAYFDASSTSQPTEHVFTFDPVPSALTEMEAKHVLGGQANIWTEGIPTTQRVEYQIFPRMTAMAEVLWSSKKGRNLGDFLNRMPMIFDRLDRMGANYFIPAPHVDMNAFLYTTKAKVSATEAIGAPGILHYSLDGTAPTLNSPTYSGPFSLDHEATVTFAYVSRSGQTGATARISCAPAHSLNTIDMVPGWQTTYYEGSWNRVPDFSLLTPVKSASSDHVGLDSRNRDTDFAMHFEGFFKAEEDGVYRFTLASDDGSWLKIEGLTVVDNDGTHPNTPREGTIWLPKGSHKVDLGYFQGKEALSLNLLVQIPGTSIPTSADSYVYRKKN